MGQFHDQVPFDPTGKVDRREHPFGEERFTIPPHAQRPMLLPEPRHELAAPLLQIGKPAGTGGLRGETVLVDRLPDDLIVERASDPRHKRSEELEREPGCLPIGLGRLFPGVPLERHPRPVELRRVGNCGRADDNADQGHRRGGKEPTCF